MMSSAVRYRKILRQRTYELKGEIFNEAIGIQRQTSANNLHLAKATINNEWVKETN